MITLPIWGLILIGLFSLPLLIMLLTVLYSVGKITVIVIIELIKDLYV